MTSQILFPTQLEFPKPFFQDFDRLLMTNHIPLYFSYLIRDYPNPNYHNSYFFYSTHKPKLSLHNLTYSRMVRNLKTTWAKLKHRAPPAIQQPPQPEPEEQQHSASSEDNTLDSFMSDATSTYETGESSAPTGPELIEKWDKILMQLNRLKDEELEFKTRIAARRKQLVAEEKAVLKEIRTRFP